MTAFATTQSNFRKYISTKYPLFICELAIIYRYDQRQLLGKGRDGMRTCNLAMPGSSNIVTWTEIYTCPLTTLSNAHSTNLTSYGSDKEHPMNPRPTRRLSALTLISATTGLAAALISAPAHAAVGAYNNANLADKALSYYKTDGNGNPIGLGTRACADAGKPGGDQCKEFENCITWMVSGHTQWTVDGGSPPNYQHSYLDAGGIAVTAATAVKGDIIQMGTYDTTDLMHTAIIVANNHDGSFQVVDANFVAAGIIGYHKWVPPTSNIGYYRMGTVDPAIPAGSGMAAPALAYDTGASTMRIYRWGTTGSSFTPPSVYTSGTYHLSAVNRLTATGDVDGDGRSDIVQAYQNGDGTFSFYVFLDGNSSAGVWYTSGSFSLAAVGGRLIVADFNGDGKAEPALVYDNGGTQTIYRWLSTGTSFTRTTDYVGTGSFHLSNVADRVAAGDVNGDGKADIVETYQLGDGTFAFYVFLGGLDSVGAWYTSGTFNLAPVANRFIVADFNGDGKAEPALIYDNGGTQTIYRWLSTGSSFARTTDYVSTGSFNLANVQDRVAAADVNGDGNADIVEAY